MACDKVKFEDGNGIIYNSRNVLLTKKDIHKMLKKGGIKVKVENLAIWQEAFTHETYALNEHNKKRNEQFFYHMKNAGKHFDRDEEGNLVEVVASGVAVAGKAATDADNESDGSDGESIHSEIDFDNVVEVQERSYEKLEWFGNRFLQTISALFLKNKYPDVDEGFLTKTHIKLVEPEVIANLAMKCGMEKFVLVSRYQELKRNGRLNPKFLRNVFTAFLACIFFDLGQGDNGLGMELVYRFFQSLFDKYGGLSELAKIDTNYKHKLMEYFHQHFKGTLPRYISINENIVDEHRYFTEGVVSGADESFVLGTGKGITKKDAQQMAAKEALVKYGMSEKEMKKVVEKKIGKTYTFANLANRNNKKLRVEDVENLLKRFGVDAYVNDLDLWQEVFVHKSYVKQAEIHKGYTVRGGMMDLQPRSYESLEYYGDRILQTISAIYLWNRYPDEDEDFFTKTQSKLVRKEHFAKLSGILGLNKYLVISRYLEQDKFGRIDKNNLEDIFEAFFGAFYQDIGKNNLKAGIGVIFEFFKELLEEHVDMAEIINTNENYKHMLMEYFHKEFNGGLPDYRSKGFIEMGGRDGGGGRGYGGRSDGGRSDGGRSDGGHKKKVFTETVHDVDGNFVAKGRSTTRQKAQQFAAKHALIAYGFIKPFNSVKQEHIKSLGMSMAEIKERLGTVGMEVKVGKKTVGKKTVEKKKMKLKIKKKNGACEVSSIASAESTGTEGTKGSKTIKIKMKK